MTEKPDLSNRFLATITILLLVFTVVVYTFNLRPASYVEIGENLSPEEKEELEKEVKSRAIKVVLTTVAFALSIGSLKLWIIRKKEVKNDE